MKKVLLTRVTTVVLLVAIFFWFASSLPGFKMGFMVAAGMPGGNELVKQECENRLRIFDLCIKLSPKSTLI
jgi:hypothetical protein